MRSTGRPLSGDDFVKIIAIVAIALLQCTKVGTAADPVQELVYGHYGQVASHQALGALQARRSHPNAKITVIVHDDTDESAWHNLVRGTGINIWKPADWKLLRKFEGVYRHASINQYQKEMYCIYRHLVLHHYMMENNVTSLIYLDLDIALFDDLWKYIPPDSTVGCIGTFGVHWTQHSLSEFARYLWNFYEREPIEIARHIAKIGRAGKGYDRQLARQRGRLMAWWPAGVQPHHLSDMWQFFDFLKKTKALNILCHAHNSEQNKKQCPPQLQLMKNLRKHPNLPRELEIPAHELLGRVKQEFEWRKQPIYGYPQPWMESLAYDGQLVKGPVPGIHFQGKSKYIMPYLLCDDLTTHFADHQQLQQLCRVAKTSEATQT